MYDTNSSCDNGMKCDVLLLANFFGKSRNISLNNYGLCLSHHLSVPTLSLDAMLNITRALISAAGMYLFFVKGMRGAVSYISMRYRQFNNKYLKSTRVKTFYYLDANTFYGYAIFNFLLTSGFKWIDLKTFDFNKYQKNSSKSSVLEVPFEYPKELLELHNDYSLFLD